MTTRRKKRQQYDRWWIQFGRSYSVLPMWRWQKRRIGKNSLLPSRETMVSARTPKYVLEPRQATPIGKRREKRAPGKPR